MYAPKDTLRQPQTGRQTVRRPSRVGEEAELCDAELIGHLVDNSSPLEKPSPIGRHLARLA